MKYKNGLVLGKFMPPHKGHEYLFRFAKQYCENLTIVVDCLEGQTISPELRKTWIKELVTGVNVVALDEFMPQNPSETENFWEIWRNKLYQVTGKPDVLIAAMDYGWELSKQLDCEFVQLDIARESMPISASEIRDNPLKHWEFLVDSARGYFMKKICLIGPESTGKSTIGSKIAKSLNTVYVPEYAKAVIDSQSGQFFEHNIKEVAWAQMRTEKALERMVNRIMVCDSDVITTMVWAEELFGKADEDIYKIAEEQKYDMTFLFYPDTAWVTDEHRQVTDSASDEFRLKMFNKMEEKLKRYNRPYLVLKGTFEEKEGEIRTLVNGWLA